jgi:hypothetical protein
VNTLVFDTFAKIVRDIKPRGKIVELGAVPSSDSLLTLPELSGEHRVGVNISGASHFGGFEILKMNANNMALFDDRSVDCVLSNAMLEHDNYFWLTLAEIRRILRPGAWAILGVPAFTDDGLISKLGQGTHWPISDANDYHNATLTFKQHGAPKDFYRFSKEAVRSVFFEGFERVTLVNVMIPPRIVGYGRMPRS